MGRPTKYPDAFRRDAVELVKSSGRPIAEVALSLVRSVSTSHLKVVPSTWRATDCAHHPHDTLHRRGRSRFPSDRYLVSAHGRSVVNDTSRVCAQCEWVLYRAFNAIGGRNPSWLTGVAPQFEGQKSNDAVRCFAWTIVQASFNSVVEEGTPRDKGRSYVPNHEARECSVVST